MAMAVTTASALVVLIAHRGAHDDKRPPSCGSRPCRPLTDDWQYQEDEVRRPSGDDVRRLVTFWRMPACAKDGKVVCFIHSAQGLNARYATFSFRDEANLDEGAMSPTSFSDGVDRRRRGKEIGSLVKKR
jgi:hypothetical protein